MDNKQHPHAELGFSPDGLAQRQAELLALLRQTAPDVVSDNRIDFERLKTLLGEEGIAPSEHYELTWAGKSAARSEIQKSTSHTLCPAADNPVRAPHMLIEGENLEVLRVLQKSYHGKVKMIYIDPPYNTGNDSFVYPDDYSETLDEYQKRTGEKNEAGHLNKQSLWKKNSKESGQYHSVWLSMMYPRLYLARNLLREDGVIFISIDDNEAANLKLLCDEIFGAENFLVDLVWEKTRKNDAKFFSNGHEYIITYAKNVSFLRENGVFFREEKPGAGDIYNEFKRLRVIHGDDFDKIETDLKEYYQTLPKDHPARKHSRYNKVDGNGVWRDDNMSWPGGNGPDYDVIHPVTKLPCAVPPGGWRFSTPEKMAEMIDSGIVVFREDHTMPPIRKTYLVRDSISDEEDVGKQVMGSYFYKSALAANKTLSDLFGKAFFDNPKDADVIKRLIKYVSESESIILDFFAGSGTTAQAVMELNLEDGGSRKFVCVQLPERLDENSEAYKAGYHTIADITRARIAKVIAKLKQALPEKSAELACAHFTLAPSHFKVWNGAIADTEDLRGQLDMFQRAEKSVQVTLSQEAQTGMLTELMLKHGMGALGVQAVSKPVQMAGVTVHRVLMADDKLMLLCFEPYTSALKEEIVKARPAQVILLNSCFVGDKADELIANLQLELSGLDIGLTVI
ncbi:site-specific DNA-methyltransferase [Aeromonas salmonicida]|uniref:site-specific DNA-methyltransferase n=1 Tax=Aeromonas salmonicida TaxID=645 RepID=UPI0039A75653